MDTSTLTVTATGADADAEAEAASVSSSLTLTSNLQLCRICISSNVNSSQMISIFGEDSLWRKIATLADVKIERGDILPQQVCLTCAKNTISACLFKKKCEDADSFYRQQLFLHKIEHKTVPQDNCGESEGDDELINGQNHHLANDNDDMSSHSYKHHHHHHGLINGDNNSAAVDGGDEEEHETHPPMTPSQFKADPEDDEHDDDDNEEQQHHVDVDANGEVKGLTNGLKPAFDFNSIRLMHEYMQQHLSKFNGLQGHATTAASDDEAAGHEGSDSDQDDDDDGPLPLIPEIELITPSEDCETGVNNGNALTADGQAMTQMRGYQCPHCYQIFEMKQVLKAHMQSVHGAAGPVYECTNCKKTYFYKRFLEKHIRRGRCVKKRRNQTRPMQCSDCNVLFPTGHHLGWHKRTGCPSKTAKMPLQQLFKQNIVQYNNFPRRGARKPENALYLHNRKLVMANNKRKGRTRIKLDARKIALAKQLILREATTTVIANELNISRTFAWRLRKSLVNGVSLHERVIDPTEEEDDDGTNDNAEEAVENVQKPENLLNHHPFTEHFIKSENIASDEEDGGNGGDHDDSETDLHRQQQTLHEDQQQYQQQQLLQNHQHDEEDDDEYHQQLRQQHNNSAVATSVIQRTAKTTTIATNKQIIAVQLQQQQQEAIEQKLHNISVVQQQRLMELKPTNNTRTTQLEQDVPPGGGGNNNGDDAGTESNEENEMTEDYRLQQQQQQETDLNTKCGVNSQQYLKNNSVKSVESPLGNNGKLPLITQLSPAVAAAIHQLPVNLSIRPIASMQNTETSPTTNSSNNNNNNNNNNNANKNSNTSSNGSSSKKKPRKPNVFIDDEKYAMAKMLVAQNASTMEIAKALNVSQMTAWKLRDAIIKGVPLSYRNKRDIRMTMVRPEEDASGSCGALSESSEGRRETEAERQQQTLLVKQQLEHQQKLQQQHLQQQQQIQQLLQRQQQLQQQQQQLEQQKLRQQQQREEEEEEEQRRQQQLQQQQQQQLKMQQQQKQEQKNLNPRRRLKAAEREVRDKEITREILELIKEDNNIQYWKVSARLAEKGYAISPSSVCQKLKSMGIHRRWKPGDKPPLIDMEHLKANTTATTTSITLNQAANSNIAAATLAAAAANAASSSADESYEQQFDMGGAHFLSAFTR